MTTCLIPKCTKSVKFTRQTMNELTAISAITGEWGEFQLTSITVSFHFLGTIRESRTERY